MHTISKTYVLKYQLNFAPHYKWTQAGRCFNAQTGREIRKVLCGRSIGYCIQGKFYSLNTLRKCLEKITLSDLPF